MLQSALTSIYRWFSYEILRLDVPPSTAWSQLPGHPPDPWNIDEFGPGGLSNFEKPHGCVWKRGRSPEITSLWWTNVQKLPVYDEQTFFLVLNKQTMCCKWATMWGLQLAKPRGYDSLVQRQSAVQGIIISVATIFFGWVDSTPQSLVLKNLDRLLVLLNYEDDWYWLIHVHLLW